jgi:hypothetical protein
LSPGIEATKDLISDLLAGLDALANAATSRHELVGAE